MPFALILSSYVAASSVGGGAQALALMPFGIDAAVIPSVLFGRHPGWGAPGGGAVEAQTMRDMIDAVAANGLHAQTDAVIAGYFVDAAQVRLAGETLDRVRANEGEAPLSIGIRLQQRAAAGMGEAHIGSGHRDLFDERPEHDASEMREGRYHRGKNDDPVPIHLTTRGSGSGTMNEPR